MEDFLKELVEKLKELTSMAGDEVFIELHDICKNNDVTQHSIVIRHEGEKISKNIYAEPYFDLNMRGTPLDEIAQTIINISNDRNYEQTIEKNLVDVTDYDAVREKLILRLVSKELNEDFLADKLYVPVGGTDLVAVFYVLVSMDKSGIASTAVTRRYEDCWHIKSLDCLYEQALSNTKKLFPPMVKSMGTFASESKLNDMDEDMLRAADNIMHILSNESAINGATSVLYKDILKDFALAHEVEELVILPSSRHEVLLLPQHGEVDYKYCEEMVTEINQYLVDPMDVLSNHVYIYRVDTDEMTMWMD